MWPLLRNAFLPPIFARLLFTHAPMATTKSKQSGTTKRLTKNAGLRVRL